MKTISYCYEEDGHTFLVRAPWNKAASLALHCIETWDHEIREELQQGFTNFDPRTVVANMPFEDFLFIFEPIQAHAAVLRELKDLRSFIGPSVKIELFYRECYAIYAGWK